MSELEYFQSMTIELCAWLGIALMTISLAVGAVCGYAIAMSGRGETKAKKEGNEMSGQNEQKPSSEERLAKALEEILKRGEEKIEAFIDYSPELNLERRVVSYTFKIGNVTFTTSALSYISTCRRQRDEFLTTNLDEITKPY